MVSESERGRGPGEQQERGRVPLWWVVLFLLLTLGIGAAVLFSLGGL